MVKSSSRLNILSILLFVGLILVSQQTLASPISVPLDHWSYHFIERFQAKGVLKDYLSNTKPYSRDEMAKMILHVIKQVEDGKSRLSKTEKAQLDELKTEFAQELIDQTQFETDQITGLNKRKYLLV